MSNEELEAKLIPAREAAKLLSVSPTRLAAWRADGKGPRYVKTGTAQSAKILYPYKALIEWIENHSVNPAKGNE